MDNTTSRLNQSEVYPIDMRHKEDIEYDASEKEDEGV